MAEVVMGVGLGNKREGKARTQGCVCYYYNHNRKVASEHPT